MPLIIFPMAGLSSRFTRAGYTVPKFKLPVGRDTLFKRIMDGFAGVKNYDFLFVARKELDARGFIAEEIERSALHGARFEVVELEEMTTGQAHTVLDGLTLINCSPDTDITIFNVDTVRKGFTPLSCEADQPLRDCMGYLEVFEGEGEHWSFVRPHDGYRAGTRIGLAAEVVEKNRISNLCSNGLYQFKSFGLFQDLYEADKDWRSKSSVMLESYVAPLYQQAIDRGEKVAFKLVGKDDMEFCGTPAEYEALKNLIG